MNRELLSNIYGCLERLNFSTLPKLLKQKHQDSLIPWSKFMALLLTFSNCENMYYRHSYLSLKNNNIQDQYIQVSNDLRNLLKIASSNPNINSTVTNSSNNNNSNNNYNSSNNNMFNKKPSLDDDPEFAFFSSLVLQTCIIVQVRIDMIGVYTTIAMSTQINQDTNFDLLVGSLETIPTIYRDKITHPLLLGIKANTNYEISILKNLLKVYVSMNKHIFKDTILLLFQARLDIDAWKDMDQQQQQNISRSYEPKWTANSIHQWLSMFFNSLMSKSSLYFHFPLRTVEEETGGTYQSFKDATLRNNPDFVLMIESFYQRSNSIFFGIFFECKGKPYSKMGYCFNNTDAPGGLGAYPPIFYIPQDKSPMQHLPNIISIYLENQSSLDRPTDIFYYVDKQKSNLPSMGGSNSNYNQQPNRSNNPSSSSSSSSSSSTLTSSQSNIQQQPISEIYDYTYFFVRIDSQMFISVVYRDIKKQKDSMIVDFLKVLVHHLRNADLFNLLKLKEGAR